MGDAAGIGPEVIVKALSDGSLGEKLRPVVIGDAKVLEATRRFLGEEVEIVEYSASDASAADTLEVIDLHNVREGFVIGSVSADTGKAAGQYIEKAFELWKSNDIDAICTAPINKESLALGGYDFPGHTEFLANLTGTNDFAMSFFAEKLRVVLLSTHLPLSDAQQKRIAESEWKTLKVGIRPEFVHVWDEPFDEAMQAQVVHVEDLGTYKIMTLNLDGAPLKVRLAEDKPVPEGIAYISFPGQWLMVYADDYLLEV